MRIKKHTLFSFILMTGMVVGLVRPVTASENQPMDILQARLEKGLALLNDAPCRTPACRTLREEHLWQLSLTLFDYATMSRLVLSSRWHDFTPQQQAAFVREFAAFLRRTYFPALLERYNGEQVEYIRQVQLSPTRARVDVHVLWQDREIPVSAKMIYRAGGWKIYDVSSLGISAIKNYRAQFRGLLRTETPDQVIAILKARKGHAR
jgi:phospholipid transport system substrate-binding protein